MQWRLGSVRSREVSVQYQGSWFSAKPRRVLASLSEIQERCPTTSIYRIARRGIVNHIGAPVEMTAQIKLPPRQGSGVLIEKADSRMRGAAYPRTGGLNRLRRLESKRPVGSRLRT